MRIAVIGATGQTGSLVTEALAKSGSEVVAVSRSGATVPGAASSASADILSGEGLAAALEGVDTVIDASNTKNFLDARIFVQGSANVVEAAVDAGVARIVVVSVLGAEHSRFQYHQRKVEQERIYRESGIETTVIRASQFMSFITTFFDNGAAMGAIPVFLGARFQPVAPSEVADLIATTAVNRLGDAEIVGPKVWVSRDLAKAWQARTRARGLIVNGPFPPKLLDFFRSGHNLSDTAMQGAIGFDEWLASQSFGAR